MIIALAQALREKKINYQQQLHVTAMDIDPLCVHMSYVQCTLLHIPALICHGDTLRGTISSQWRTFAHTMGLWDAKLARDDRKLPTRGPAQAPPQGTPTESAATPGVPPQPISTQS